MLGVAGVVQLQEEEWLEAREVAQRLGISRRWVYELIHNGKIRAKERWSLTGNKRFWLIPQSEVERLKKLTAKGGEE